MGARSARVRDDDEPSWERVCTVEKKKAVNEDKVSGRKQLKTVRVVVCPKEPRRAQRGKVKGKGDQRKHFLLFSGYGDRVQMDLVDLYLPECFSYHSDTE